MEVWMSEQVQVKQERRPVVMKGNRDSDRPYRRVDCDHYRDCLDVALSQKWSDFSCHKCKAYARTTFMEQMTGSDGYW
jgi:hypothetical protein